jgi:hypothetical protein
MNTPQHKLAKKFNEIATGSRDNSNKRRHLGTPQARVVAGTWSSNVGMHSNPLSYRFVFYLAVGDSYSSRHRCRTHSFYPQEVGVAICIGHASALSSTRNRIDTYVYCLRLVCRKAKRVRSMLAQQFGADEGGGTQAAGPKAGLSQQQMQAMVDGCLKLAAERKINEKNVWDLPLLDHLHDLVSSERAANVDAYNFQKATLGLDAGVQIYEKRVDSTYNEAMKSLVLAPKHAAGKSLHESRLAGYVVAGVGVKVHSTGCALLSSMLPNPYICLHAMLPTSTQGARAVFVCILLSYPHARDVTAFTQHMPSSSST